MADDETPESIEHPQDLFRAKDHRQLVFLLGERDHFDNPIPLQSDVVEKPKGADRHGPAADAHLPFLGQVDLVAADLFRTYAVR